MKDPKRSQAIEELNSNSEIRRILEKYPALKPILQKARNYKPVPGYHRISLYYHHKQDILQIAREPDAGKIYTLIGDLLPMDASDKESDDPCISGTF